MNSLSKAQIGGIVAAVFVVLGFIYWLMCPYVEQGEVALAIYKWGGKKGEIEVRGQGTQPWMPNIDYKIFPTTQQQWSWTAGDAEGSETNEEIVFQSEGEKLSADIGIEFSFSSKPEELVAMYRKYKRTPQEMIDQYLRKDVRSFFNEVTQALPIEKVYSTCKDSIRVRVQTMIQAKYDKEGIDIAEITYLSNI